MGKTTIDLTVSQSKREGDCPDCDGSGYEYGPSNTFDAEPEMIGYCASCHGTGQEDE